MKENCKYTGGQPTNPTTPSKDREFVDRQATTSHFKVTRDSAFTGTNVKNDDGTSSNADDINFKLSKNKYKLGNNYET
ncbi:unknown [Clostridium sp. CAG:568]|nr:unknown [Clostridium sp. CAG:568]